MENIMQAVLMVAGKSTRTYPLTLTRPKPLLPIMNRPLIEHSLDQLVGLFDEIIFITGYRKEMIEAALGSCDALDALVTPTSCPVNGVTRRLATAWHARCA